MVNTGAPVKSQAMVCKAVVQSVLMYGSKIWVITDAMMMILEGFYHRITRRVAGMTAHRGDGREWGWVLVEAVMGETNL